MEVIYIAILFLIFYKLCTDTSTLNEKLMIKGNPDFIHKEDVYVKLYKYLKLLKEITL